MLLAIASTGQVPRRLEDCLPVPSLAQDIEQRVADAEAQSPQPHIRLVRLVFRGQTGLPPEELAQVARSLKARTYNDDPGWLDELAYRTRDAFQQRGYFTPVIGDLRSRLLAATPKEKRFAVNVSLHAGTRYRLNKIEFLNSTQFSYGELRAFLPIHNGDIFNTHVIQQGIEKMRRAYATKGFVNFTLGPSFDIDERHRLITLILDLAENKQFSLGQVKVLGLDPALAQKLLKESGLEAGAVFDTSLVNKFFERNKSILPKDAAPEEDTERRINEQTGTVDITLDFRRCPQLPDP